MRVFCPQLVERAKGASLVRVIWRAAGGDIYIRYDTIRGKAVKPGRGCVWGMLRVQAARRGRVARVACT